jgi:hypothetical protein
LKYYEKIFITGSIDIDAICGKSSVWQRGCVLFNNQINLMNMFYNGMPFNQFSVINSLNEEESYFREMNMFPNLFSNIYERVIDGKIILVMYNEPQLNIKDLNKYHAEHYSDLPYQIINQCADKTFKITKININKIIYGYEIIQYDSLWRDSIFQIFDENHLLIEYRQIYYNNEERSFAKEKIFYAASWHISEEIY